MTTIPLCNECTDRRAEAVLVDQPGTSSLYFCFDCLREHPEFRFFRILPGTRKPPKDLTLRRVEEAQALREQGMTYYAIGDRFSVGHVAVQRWLKPDMAQRALRDSRKWYATSNLAQVKRDRRREYNTEHPLYVTWY